MKARFQVILAILFFSLMALEGTAFCAESTNGEIVTLRLANLSVGLESIYQMLGIEKGIYQKHGVDLQVINFVKGGAEAAAATASGQVDMGSFGTPILTAISKGIPIKLVAAPPQPGMDFVLTALPEIKTVEDLRGKTVGAGNLGGGNHQSFLRILNGHGMTENDVKLIATGGVDRALVLQSKQVAAIQVSPEDAARIVSEGIGYVLDEANNYYKDYQHSYIFATDEFIAKHPETIVNFLRAHKESFEYSRDHLDELVDLAKSIINMKEDAIREYYTSEFKKWDLSLAIDPKGAAGAVNILKEMGEIESDVEFDPATWIDARFLKEAAL